MPDKIVNHFVLADGSVARYEYDGLLGTEPVDALLNKTPYTCTWEQGSLGTGDGSVTGSSTRIRTADYIETVYPVVVSFPSTLKISYRVYNSDNSFSSSSDWIEGGLNLVPQNGQKYKFVVAYKTNAAIVPDAAADVVIYACQYTDKTLSIEGRPADAKVTGDILAGINKAFSITWESGNIQPSGEETVNVARCRSVEYFDFENLVVVSNNNKYEYAFRYYDKTKTIVGLDNDWRTGETKCNNLRLQYPSCYYVRICGRKANNSRIEPNEFTEFEKSVSARFVFSYDLLSEQLKGKQAVAKVSGKNNYLGNSTIRAAKTVQFSDGTPPIIEWFLIQTVDKQFYRTKDFVTKEYLFPSPVNDIANWSVGITGKDDVIFVADAAGLSDTNGRLNDANRVNPICLLASENYTVKHTIDFGTNKKPCGWLENVGYCVLPSGNLVFCEYTRGTVKTANVWAVDTTDITDPDNWATTWTHDIIDDTGVTADGIKHCHEMQYDFYTGILYFGTGDSPTGSFSYYSTDNGATWTLLYGPDKKKCRRLNYAFTENKVYWASDSFETQYHAFFIAERNNAGVVDVANAREVSLAEAYTGINFQACYGVVYLEEIGAVVLMDRVDVVGADNMKWFCYDIATDSIKQIGVIKSVNGATNVNLGFRCKFVEWYPKGNNILVGFNLTAAHYNADTNVNALCGNQGGTTGDGSTRVNNLALYVNRLPNGNYTYRADTKYC